MEVLSAPTDKSDKYHTVIGGKATDCNSAIEIIGE